MRNGAWLIAKDACLALTHGTLAGVWKPAAQPEAGREAEGREREGKEREGQEGPEATAPAWPMPARRDP